MNTSSMLSSILRKYLAACVFVVTCVCVYRYYRLLNERDRKLISQILRKMTGSWCMCTSMLLIWMLCLVVALE